MRLLIAAIIMTGALSFIGCSSLQQHPEAHIEQSTDCIDRGWYGSDRDGGCPDAVKTVSPEAPHEMAPQLAALEPEPRAAKPAVEKKQHGGPLTSHICDLEQQLADRERETALHHSVSSDPAKLSNPFSTGQSELSVSQEETNRLAADLAAAKKSIMDLQLQLDQSNESLTKAERNLLKALHTEILRVECRSISHEKEAYEGIP